MKISSFVRIAIATCALALGSAPLAQASIIYAPVSAKATEGSTNNCIPFSCFGPSHYQQVFDGALFGNTAGIIRSLMFRTDQPSASFTDQVLNLSITLSTTAASSMNMNSTFASNLGSNAKVVMSGAQTFSAKARPGSKTVNFVVDIADTFYYDGVSNLLMDIKLNSGSIGVALDAINTSTSGTRRLYSNRLTSATGSTDSLGLVTAFDIDGTNVPEPGTLVLFCIALAGITSARRKRKSAL
ncbi:MAG: putative rane protein [Massilia sp.]|jgi:hypothetical protein|nr:putative rane protein [Massilia sp.]